VKLKGSSPERKQQFQGITTFSPGRLRVYKKKKESRGAHIRTGKKRRSCSSNRVQLQCCLIKERDTWPKKAFGDAGKRKDQKNPFKKQGLTAIKARREVVVLRWEAALEEGGNGTAGEINLTTISNFSFIRRDICRCPLKEEEARKRNRLIGDSQERDIICLREERQGDGAEMKVF